MESQTHCPVLVLHSCPEAQAAQAAPAVPHELFDSEPQGTQVEPLQQPFGHVVESQKHCPVFLLHACPEAQAAQAAPAVPQELFDSDVYGTQVLPLQQP